MWNRKSSKLDIRSASNAYHLSFLEATLSLRYVDVVSLLAKTSSPNGAIVEFKMAECKNIWLEGHSVVKFPKPRDWNE